MDRCERTNENGESTFWEEHWLKRPIKKEGVFLVHKNDAKHIPPQKKKHILQNQKKNGGEKV